MNNRLRSPWATKPGLLGSVLVAVLLAGGGSALGQIGALPGSSQPLPLRFAFWDRYQQFASPAAWPTACGDIDQDGDLDVVFTNQVRDIGVARNRGDASFEIHYIDLSELNTVLGLAIADIDGDRDLDVIVGQTDGISGRSPNHVLLNDGLGNLSVAKIGTRLPTTCTRGMCVAAADFDRDGDIDLFFGRGLPIQGLQNQLLLNDGKGFYTDVTATHVPGDQEVTTSLAVGDFDRDGDLDVACANGGYLQSGPQTIYWNDGAARFTLGTTSPYLEPGMWITAGDFDQNGALDLYIALSGPRDRLLLNDGTGRFSDASHRLTSRPLGVKAHVVSTLDIDGDGDLDIAVGGLLDILVNNGRAEFTPTGSTLVSHRVLAIGAMIPADFDGDGDQDVVMTALLRAGNPQPFKTLLNLTTQLYTQSEVRIGMPYALTFYGEPGTLMIPLVASKPARIDLGSLGILALDPAALIPLQPRHTSATREARWQTDVPNDPGLRGVPIYAQAVSVDLPRTGRMRLTNWIVDTIQ